MILTKKQEKELEVIRYFIPVQESSDNDFWVKWRSVEITDKDIKSFFDYSERGIVCQKLSLGLQKLIEGKRWREIHIQELYKKNHSEKDMIPWYLLLGGEDEEIMPRAVVDHIKKEISCCATLIENCYQIILSDI